MGASDRLEITAFIAPAYESVEPKSVRRAMTGCMGQIVYRLSMRFRTISHAPNRLMIFARVPERGKVKTRLALEVGEEKALKLYEAMLRDLVDSVGTSDEQLCVEIVWNGSDELDGATVRRIFPHHELSMQSGRDLGERLLLAFHERVVFHQAAKVVAIGSDDPTLTREIIEKAFLLLESCDWVIGPASDGGYYLIG